MNTQKVAELGDTFYYLNTEGEGESTVLTASVTDVIGADTFDPDSGLLTTVEGDCCDAEHEIYWDEELNVWIENGLDIMGFEEEELSDE